MKRRSLIAVAAVVACASVGGLGAATVLAPKKPGSQATTVYDVKAHLFSTPGGLSDTDRVALVEAFVKNEPPPQGVTFVETQGDVSGVVTGLMHHPTGRNEILISVSDETTDLDEARVYVDSVLKNTATRENGKIVDHPDGTSTASMPIFVKISQAHDYRVEWDDSTSTRTRTFTPFHD